MRRVLHYYLKAICLIVFKWLSLLLFSKVVDFSASLHNVYQLVDPVGLEVLVTEVFSFFIASTFTVDTE